MGIKTRPIRVVREQISNLRVSIDSHETKLKINGEHLDFASAELAIARNKWDIASAEHTKQQRIVKALNDKLTTLLEEESKINTAVSRTPTVSDHALVRYIERVLNIDIDQVRRTIVGRDGGTIKKMDDGEISRDDYSLVVKNSTVVTVIK